MEETLLLNQNEIKELVTMKDVVDLVDKTFQDMGKEKTVNPTKVLLDLGETAAYPPYEGFMNAMPAFIGWQDIAGIKWAGGLLGERKALGLPYITSMILLINPKIGNFVSVMDGAFITNFRTGAQTANALKYIKKDQKSIKVGLYGAGMQGRTQTMALAEVFDIEELTVYDIYPEASKKFQEEMKDYVRGDIIVAKEPKDAAGDVDTIICVTQSKDAFLKDEWVKPGTVVFPMGSYQEVENEFILNSDHIVVDHVEQSLHRGVLKNLNEQGKIMEENIHATIGELSIEKKKIDDPGNKRVICIPIGTGAMDISVAKFALDEAKKKNMGTPFDFLA